MTKQNEKAKEKLSAQGRSTNAPASADVRAPEASPTRAQQLLKNERERLRTIESTITELMMELAAELSSSESRLQQLEGDLGTRNGEVDDLRAELEMWKLECQQRNEKLAEETAGLPADELAQKLAETELALLESQNEQQEVRGQLAKAHKQLNVRAQELNDLRAQLVEASMNCADDPKSSAEVTHELLELRAERQLLVQRLADAECQLHQFAQIDITEIDQLRRRFEMAVQDVRELKVKNSQLETELQKAKNAAPAGTAAKSPEPAGSNSDWERRKRMLLEQLESDFTDDSPQQKKERLSIEGTLRITDDVVAQRDREIAALREQLADAAHATTASEWQEKVNTEIVDNDELVLQARERLRKMEAEMSEKLRRAEVEISVERAKLARERSSIDERSRQYEQNRGDQSATGKESSKNEKESAKPSKGGRWLARLGLKDDKS